MRSPSEPPSDTPSETFEHLAAQARDNHLVGEFLAFLRDNKKWWLLPILIILALIGLLVMLSGTAAAPFIYTLF